ncbi:alanine racemase [Allorhizocola rhizosphaerae]|uniref:alanine racemase n=1 Tax=Allorhizocola rhizosphaerae TaxID=1872709 RepID=UPI000E3BAF61|nr:alanine racemase [Allorhizocola rhizosphaerae]
MWQAELEIDLGAIRDNADLLKAATSAEIMAVVKADGYGHGAVESARAALAGGATWLGVCTLGEAAHLREAGIEAPMLAWLWLPGQPLGAAIGQRVDLGVSSHSQLTAVIEVARATGLTAGTHLKIDTGLSRGGAAATDWAALLETAAAAQAEGLIDVVGVWSHLANADSPGHDSVDRQLKLFHEALEAAKRAGLAPRVRHLANSAALLTRPDTHFDLVRVGIALYGLPPVDTTLRLKPAMTARARVIHTKRLAEGEGVSYGYTYITPRATTVALVPIGYADGVPRHASNIGPVQINGARYRIAGRVCMDQFVVDVGDAEVSDGDEVVLFGSGERGEPTAEDWARAIDTISYEIVTRMGSGRVQRTHIGIA